jgi:hypothetical protein
LHQKIKNPSTVQVEGQQDTGIEPVEAKKVSKPVVMWKSVEICMVTGFFMCKEYTFNVDFTPLNLHST